MGLKNMSLLTEPTIAVTGGTPFVFADDGQTIANGVHLVVPGDTNFQSRRQATAKVKQPSLDPKTGQYGKDKKSISLAIPVVLDTGRVVFNTIRIERELHPSFESAAAGDLMKVAAQLCISSDVSAFWDHGSLA